MLFPVLAAIPDLNNPYFRDGLVGNRGCNPWIAWPHNTHPEAKTSSTRDLYRGMSGNPDKKDPFPNPSDSRSKSWQVNNPMVLDWLPPKIPPLKRRAMDVVSENICQKKEISQLTVIVH